MKIVKVLLAGIVLILFASQAQAKENKKQENTQLEKARQEFAAKLGSQTGKIQAKEIPEGFVFESGKGKVTLLILWTKDCKSCVENIPNFNRILLDFRGKVNIIAVELSGMSSKELQQYAKDKKVLYTLISGAENKEFTAAVMRKFGFNTKKEGLPFQVVLGYTGHNNGIIKGIAKIDDMERFLQKIIDYYEKKGKQNQRETKKQMSPDKNKSEQKPKKKLEPIRI